MLDEQSKMTIKVGEVVKGTVLSVNEDVVYVNIGYKHDAMLKKADFTSDPEAVLTDLVTVGQEVEAKILKVNDGDGNVILSMRKSREIKESETLKEAFENQTALTVTVAECVKGGLIALVDDVRVFIPSSLVSDRFEKDQSHYVGQEIRINITEYDPKKHRFIGDRKTLLVAEKTAAKDAIINGLKEYDIVEGTVKNITKFGAFVDLGGADGLIYNNDMSWLHIGNHEKFFKVGQTVQAFVKSIDTEKKQINLSCLFPDQNPWLDADTKYAPGTVVKGTVARFFKDQGVFVNLAEGIDAYLHVSQISWERVEKPEDVLTIGQEIEAKIKELDLEKQRISLSMKELTEAPKREPVQKKGRGPKHQQEETYTVNADGTLNIESFTQYNDKKLEEQEAKKAEEALVEAAAEVVTEAVTEAQEVAAEAATETTEA